MPIEFFNQVIDLAEKYLKELVSFFLLHTSWQDLAKLTKEVNQSEPVRSTKYRNLIDFPVIEVINFEKIFDKQEKLDDGELDTPSNGDSMA